jgi:hypothetical protein
MANGKTCLRLVRRCKEIKVLLTLTCHARMERSQVEAENSGNRRSRSCELGMLNLCFGQKWSFAKPKRAGVSPVSLPNGELPAPSDRKDLESRRRIVPVYYRRPRLRPA